MKNEIEKKIIHTISASTVVVKSRNITGNCSRIKSSEDILTASPPTSKCRICGLSLPLHTSRSGL